MQPLCALSCWGHAAQCLWHCSSIGIAPMGHSHLSVQWTHPYIHTSPAQYGAKRWKEASHWNVQEYLAIMVPANRCLGIGCLHEVSISQLGTFWLFLLGKQSPEAHCNSTWRRNARENITAEHYTHVVPQARGKKQITVKNRTIGDNNT